MTKQVGSGLRTDLAASKGRGGAGRSTDYGVRRTEYGGRSAEDGVRAEPARGS